MFRHPLSPLHASAIIINMSKLVHYSFLFIFCSTKEKELYATTALFSSFSAYQRMNIFFCNPVDWPFSAPDLLRRFQSLVLVVVMAVKRQTGKCLTATTTFTTIAAAYMMAIIKGMKEKWLVYPHIFCRKKLDRVEKRKSHKT